MNRRGSYEALKGYSFKIPSSLNFFVWFGRFTFVENESKDNNGVWKKFYLMYTPKFNSNTSRSVWIRFNTLPHMK